MNQIVEYSQKDSRKSGSGKHLLTLGRAPPSPNDVSDFWINKVPSIPIVDLQKQNNSIVHCLLCAFVKVDPEPNEASDNALGEFSSDVESDDGSNCGDDDEEILLTHPPIPIIEYHDYLCRSFEERLELELKDAGLEKPDDAKESFNSVFTQEIEQFKEELNILQPQIEAQGNEIKSLIPAFRQDEERRAGEQQTYLELIREVKKKAHKK